MFFTFSQNNSGGSFDFDEKMGISEYVIIEAADSDDALGRAEEIGLYFDGVDDGRDCPCCGDRWSDWLDDGDKYPSIYGTPVDEVKMPFVWLNPTSFIHYLDSRIESVVFDRTGE